MSAVIICAGLLAATFAVSRELASSHSPDRYGAATISRHSYASLPIKTSVHYVDRANNDSDRRFAIASNEP
jgi:hypothetical protein